MAFKLPGFGGKKTNIKEGMDKKYGHGEYSRGGKKFEERMKPGESKFKYDVRMRKEGRKATTSTDGPESRIDGRLNTTPNILSSGAGTQAPLNGQGADRHSYDYQPQERNPGDLRVQSRSVSIELPSAPGDEWSYEWDKYENSDRLRAWDKDGNLHDVTPGSKADKAIRERYTGSETGDLSNWYGHDTQTHTSTWDDETGLDIEGTEIYEEKKSYLPYDLAQKHYNPKYKGSKK